MGTIYYHTLREVEIKQNIVIVIIVIVQANL